MLEEAQQRCVVRYRLPIQPINLVIVAIHIVVALLRMAYLITHEDHRHALTSHEDRDGIFDLTETQFIDSGIVRCALSATVPTVIIVAAIIVLFPIYPVL